ncbi:MAG: c-type cytochrome [Cyclobacteriaceae bacterium]|nr:c-type cytochrome [Cyclobacteriaceae bacterium]
MKKFFITLSLFVLTLPLAFGQDAAAATPAATSFLDDPLLPFYIVVGFIFIIALLVLTVAAYMLRVLNIMTRQAEKERAEKLGIEFKEAPSMLKRLWEEWNSLKPLEKESEIMLDHNYDGIRELDNHLPPWWKWLFYFTIGFAAVYLMVFEVFNTLPTQLQEYDNEVAYAQQQALKRQASNPVAAIDENSVEATTDALALADGKQTFLTTCASCHRKDGGGDIGPNLTDEYWLHGGTIKDVFKVVRHGVAGTNMIAWEGVISPEKMKNVASYVLTLQGSNPANPKKPQGDLFKPEIEKLKGDTVKMDTVKTQAAL